jgi:hypothetical protein
MNGYDEGNRSAKSDRTIDKRSVYNWEKDIGGN